MTALSAHSFAMRVHIYPDIGGGLATGSPFRMKVDTNGGARQARNNDARGVLTALLQRGERGEPAIRRTAFRAQVAAAFLGANTTDRDAMVICKTSRIGSLF